VAQTIKKIVLQVALLAGCSTLLSIRSSILAENLIEDSEPPYPAVVRIRNAVTGKVGAGVIVKLAGDEAYILTAAHVVEKKNEHMLQFYGKQQEFKARVRKVERETPTKALAVIVVTGQGTLPATLRELVPNEQIDIRNSQPFKGIGFPNQDIDWRSFKCNTRGLDGSDLLLDLSCIDEGMSGGPVLLDGDLVGLITDFDAAKGYARPAKNLGTYLEGSLSQFFGKAPKIPAQNVPEPGENRSESEKARRQIERSGYQVNDEGFVQSLRNGDAGLINDFLVFSKAFLRRRFEHDQSALMIVAESGFPEIVRQLLMQCGNDDVQGYLNGRDDLGRTPLMVAAAAKGGYLPQNTIEALLKAGADVSLKDDAGKTALVWAASKGNTPIVSRLIEAGADFKPQELLSLSPLIAAAGGGHNDTVNELMKKGADKDFSNFDGNTALMEASMNAKPGVVQILLAAQVNVRKKNKNTNQTALELARSSLQHWREAKPSDTTTVGNYQLIIEMLDRAK
jgi:ankyrin repeat protein